ncbi:ORF6N domain-containing protein [Caloramator sp.]|uniref:ORF6N domain-containing protein n=1 Tax=Caloramator sp. TaxID=1871330 RepID=UPI0025BD05F9|nr:ORF6N domain-containing protein [Caloramator sp.]
MNYIVPIEYKDQRVMTTKVLAEQFGTEEKNIQMNFLNNQGRFFLGKHYYKLEGNELKNFKESLPNDIREPLKYVSQLILWTDRGAARHAKILDTDEAWEVYERLEETYFKVREQNIMISQLSPELQMFKHIFDTLAKAELKQKEIEQKQQILEHRLNNLDATNIEGTPRQRLNQMIRKYALQNGIPYNTAWQHFRSNFNRAYGMNIEQRRSNFMARNSIKDISYPEFLERIGYIEDALRVADKMLNQQS